jgi:hypothetical protein
VFSILARESAAVYRGRGTQIATIAVGNLAGDPRAAGTGKYVSVQLTLVLMVVMLGAAAVGLVLPPLWHGGWTAAAPEQVGGKNYARQMFVIGCLFGVAFGVTNLLLWCFTGWSIFS